jgi:hypothetical protein
MPYSTRVEDDENGEKCCAVKKLHDDGQTLLTAGAKSWRSYKTYVPVVLCLFLFLPMLRSSRQNFSEVSADGFLLVLLSAVP